MFHSSRTVPWQGDHPLLAPLRATLLSLFHERQFVRAVVQDRGTCLWLKPYSVFAFLIPLVTVTIFALNIFITIDSHTTVMRGLVVPLLERINRETTAIVSGAECVTIVETLFLTVAAFVIRRG